MNEEERVSSHDASLKTSKQANKQTENTNSWICRPFFSGSCAKVNNPFCKENIESFCKQK